MKRYIEEEERACVLEDENEKLQEGSERLRKKIFNLKLEINQIGNQKSSNQEVNTLEHENLELNEEKERLKGEMEKIKIMCKTYETKMYELIDRHNEDIEKYENDMRMMRETVLEQKTSGEARDKDLRRVMDLENGKDKESELHKLRESLMKARQKETQFLNLKSENGDLKLEVLHVKQKYMNLLNKYTLLRKSVRRIKT